MNTSSQRLGRYELQNRLGEGGMGEVWKALDTLLQRHVAIKLLHGNIRQDPNFVTRFEQEARVIAALSHPNIVEIHDFAFEQKSASETLGYMVMDYVEGQTLADYIRETSRQQLFPSALDLVYLFTSISLALDYAHSKGTIHRDIKPANILLDQRIANARAMGKPILTDFGIAKMQTATTHTVVGTILGTPNYISPELAESKGGDFRSDLYSLGVILYEMTTGVTPFRGETLWSILRQHIQDAPPPPEQFNSRITPELSATILKSIAKNPDERYQSASAMTIDLARAFRVPIPAALSTPAHPVQITGDMSTIATPLTPAPTTAPSWTSYKRLPTTTSEVDSEQTARVSDTPVPSPSGNWNMVAIPAGVRNSPLPQPKKRPPWLLPVLLTTVLLVVLGTGAGLFALLTNNSTNPKTNNVGVSVGQIHFINSSGATTGIYDALQLDLHNIPAPKDGEAYYAWINIVGVEKVLPNWQVTPKNGLIRQDRLTFAALPNLYYPNSTFLITTEQTDMGPPTIPNPGSRLYYAKITKEATTFTVIPCPSSAGVCG